MIDLKTILLFFTLVSGIFSYHYAEKRKMVRSMILLFLCLIFAVGYLIKPLSAVVDIMSR